ncbi:hypothetical protein [Egbenema bharatensis]|uniref:hypothetical protein n=1 Tax=Egbenema bharatensis TaxID=3463334 RepID=UPI003A854783
MTIHPSTHRSVQPTAARRRMIATQKNLRGDVVQAQEHLYSFLLKIVKTWPAHEVLQEFKQIYIYQTESASSDIIPALSQLLFANQETEFRNTLKRSCYILINNWEISRNHQAICQLIELFSDPSLEKPSSSRTLTRLRKWLQNFVQSQDFQELKLFIARHDDRNAIHWSHRYAPYLLLSQYVNSENSVEQRQAARNLYVQLKERFKFDLALYTAHSDQLHSRNNSRKNPTSLADDVFGLIQKIVAKQGVFNYSNLARIFLKQVQDVTYRQFKHSLPEYLIFSSGQSEIATELKQQLSEKLTSLYSHHDADPLDQPLLIRSVNKVIDYLTLANGQEPAALFVLLLTKGNSLTLVIVLLKLILICPYSRIHLEARIASLIKYYEQYPEEECQWIIHFLEVFNITMTIHTENVEYSLVSMNQHCTTCPTPYRIFSQTKSDRRSEPAPELLSSELPTDDLKQKQ